MYGRNVSFLHVPLSFFVALDQSELLDRKVYMKTVMCDKQKRIQGGGGCEVTLHPIFYSHPFILLAAYI